MHFLDLLPYKCQDPTLAEALVSSLPHNFTWPPYSYYWVWKRKA